MQRSSSPTAKHESISNLSLCIRGSALIVKEMYRSETVVSESAVLVGVVLPSHQFPGDPLDELEGLAQSAGARIVGQLTQRREVPDKTTYLGKGKVEELHAGRGQDADVVIFDNDLSPAKLVTLKRRPTSRCLIARELILDIFASRAQTHEARLAVELAQLAILAAAIEADVDPLVAIEDGHRHARSGRKAIGSRPPPG